MQEVGGARDAVIVRPEHRHDETSCQVGALHTLGKGAVPAADGGMHVRKAEEMLPLLRHEHHLPSVSHQRTRYGGPPSVE